MGDGQHMWAACEWAMMLRNCFVREEHGRLIVGSGVRPEWWRTKSAILGPTLTPFGPVTVRITTSAGPAATGSDAQRQTDSTPNACGRRSADVVVEGTWRGVMPQLDVRVPGFTPQQRTANAAREEFSLSAS